MTKKDKVTIGFKSGRAITVMVDHLTVEKNLNNNEVIGIKWESGPRLLYMNLSQIEYVIEEV